MAPTPFCFDEAWWFPTPPDDLWEVLTRTDRYVEWWSWLREFDADGFHRGATAHCTIQSPFPYSLRCTITIDEIRVPHLVTTTVTGDLHGPARLEIEPDGAGSTARLCWSVSLDDPVLSRLARVARPAMAWAHDRVVAVGVDQFRRRALSEAR